MDIKIYTVPTCKWSKDLKTWLKRKRLSFEEHDLSESEKARDEVINLSGQMSSPTIVIDSQVIVGFDEKALLEAIGK